MLICTLQWTICNLLLISYVYMHSIFLSWLQLDFCIFKEPTEIFSKSWHPKGDTLLIATNLASCYTCIHTLRTLTLQYYILFCLCYIYVHCNCKVGKTKFSWYNWRNFTTEAESNRNSDSENIFQNPSEKFLFQLWL